MRAAQPKEPKEPGSRSGRITVVVQDQLAGHAPGLKVATTTAEDVIDVIGIEVNMNSLSF